MGILEVTPSPIGQSYYSNLKSIKFFSVNKLFP